ncbi:hypothetical protein D6810_01175 [Candidatus Dojkabacteria bacterium]|uniref:ABC-2 type transporter transmembrane domain-containing protein n=1 Tax=Candidatus Dojkabacteria bacterium TaxID=2099670 RepID=A0A3M0Z036_9BACT|nr:MAG: hypothetical protein D6810_01175 [Candidatus Dojkabacteria bacterium]
MFSEFKRRFSNRRQYIDLLWVFVKTSFKMRYQNSILGVFWVMAKPLLTFLLMFQIWSGFGKNSQVGIFPIYLLTGVVFFTYFQELVIYGQMSLLEKAHIILKVSFPRQIAVVSSLLNALINLFINLIVVFFIIFINRLALKPEGMLYFLFLVITLFIFCSGLAFFTSILTIRFRDLKNIFDLGLFLLFWSTPVFYTLENNPLFDQSAIDFINSIPFTHLLNQVRASFGLYYEIDPNFALTFFIVSVTLLVIGWRSFSVRVKKIAEYF